MPADRTPGDDGFSLVEVMLASALLAVVAAICFAFLLSAQTTEAKTQLDSAVDDQVRLAVQQIDQQVRSGNLIYDPTLETAGNAGPACSPITRPADDCVASGFSLRVYTQANGANKCVQWRVYDQTLQSRSWNQDGSSVTGWATVADHISNADASPSSAPFSLDGTPSYGGRVLDIDLVVNQGQGATGEVQSSITGRNTEYGYPNSVCAVVPTP